MASVSFNVTEGGDISTGDSSVIANLSVNRFLKCVCSSSTTIGSSVGGPNTILSNRFIRENVNIYVGIPRRKRREEKRREEKRTEETRRKEKKREETRRKENMREQKRTEDERI